MTERDIFIAALQKERRGERQAFLDSACAGEPDLRKQVNDLLRLHENAGRFLEDPATDNSSPCETAGNKIGPYKLIEPIGEGGMGSVWMAQQIEPVKRFVAVKLIKAGMDSKQIIARFEAERQALALMDHPNIARVLDAGATSDGRPFFVMDLVKGAPITAYCDEHHLTPRERLELFIPVCQAVQHAHQKGVIHRDLKPSNVLVAMYDGRPVPKVIDFGVAKAAGQPLTEQSIVTGLGAIVGTLEYMSPEQAELNQLDIDTRSDIYSLGVLLYELLVGSPPFSRQETETVGLLETLRVIREKEPPKPSMKLSTTEGLPALAANRSTEPAKLAKLVRGELDWIVMKALEKNRDRRYETADAFALDLQRYLAGEPVLACPPSVAYRFRKFAWRNRVPVLAASIILLLLIGGIVGTTFGLMEARRQRDAAEQARQDEVRAKDRADEQRAIAQATNDFLLKDLLGQAYAGNQPFGAGLPERSSQITVRELLDRAQKAVEGKFADRPLVEAAVRQTLADTYHGLGEYDLAIPQAKRALALRRTHLSADHLDTLASQTNLARTYWMAGKRSEGIALLEQVRDARAKKLGPDHLDTLATMHDLGIVLSATGKTREGIELLETVRASRGRQLGPDHVETVKTLTRLGVLYPLVGKSAEAISMLEQARDVRVKQHGPDHPLTLETLHHLAAAYLAAGKTREAIDLFERVRDLRVKVLEPDHSDTLDTMDELAEAYKAAGRLPEAIGMYEHVVEVMQRKYPQRDLQLMVTLDGLAAAYHNAGRFEDAIRQRQKIQVALEKKYGPESPHTLPSLFDLAVCYEAAGKFDQALPLFHRAAVGVEKGKFQLRVAGQIVDSLSRCHEQLKQFDQAEVWRQKWLAAVRERATNKSSANTVELTEALERLVRLYEQWERPDEAAKWRTELERAKDKR